MVAKLDKWRKKRNLLEVFKTEIPSIDQLLTLFTAVLPEIHEKDMARAFYLSKMTVVEETDKGNYEYTFIRWPEFLEFLGRIAWFKYLKTP